MRESHSCYFFRTRQQKQRWQSITAHIFEFRGKCRRYKTARFMFVQYLKNNDLNQKKAEHTRVIS